MKIATGHLVSGDREILPDVTRVCFLADDGRAMFEVGIGADGRSVEVRGVDAYIHDGTLYTEALEICPRGANVVELRTVRYGT